MWHDNEWATANKNAFHVVVGYSLLLYAAKFAIARLMRISPVRIGQAGGIVCACREEVKKQVQDMIR